jgi:hypothetical protein
VRTFLRRFLIAALAATAASCGSASAPVDLGARQLNMTSASGQPELLLVPPGALRGLVVFMHGFDADQSQIIGNAGFAPLRTALLHAGYAIAASQAHGSNAGNPASVQDQIDVLRDAEARLPPISNVDVLAFSMGGLDALLIASDRSFPHLRALALISPVCDQSPFLHSRFGSAISAAYDDPPPGELATVVNRSDPRLRPASSFRGYAYQFWQSPSDGVVPRTQSEAMSSHLSDAGIAAPIMPLTGGHGDVSALVPADVIRLFDRAGTAAERARS